MGQMELKAIAQSVHNATYTVAEALNNALTAAGIKVNTKLFFDTIM
jgi:glycine cleavage system pyridoxal-binding protein P